MGDLLDNPNQQVVRGDGSGPGVGQEAAGQPADTAAEAGSPLDEMTKEQLLAYAQELGVVPANAAMSKAEIRAGVDAKLAEGG